MKNFSPSLGKNRSRRAFTLVEIMTATAIMLILIMFTTRIASDMLKAYSNTISSLAANADSRAVLDPITEDMGTLYFPEDGKYWLEVRYDENDQGNLTGEALPCVYFFSQARDRIRRIVNGNSTEELPATIAAIAYRVKQESPFGTTVSSPENLSYIFYRSTLNTRDTQGMAMGYVIGNQTATTAETRLPSLFWKSSEQITDPTDERKYNVKNWATDLQNYTCDGIVSLYFSFWYDDLDDGKRKIAIMRNSDLETQMRQSYPDNDIRVFSKSIAIASDKIMFDERANNTINARLRAIDVSVTILDQAGRELLSAEQRQRNSGKIDDEKFTQILREHGVTYTRNIKIKP
ncbi:MAG: prepilin-type N-terminal cleavage/methylation domain-containing protein [Opitutales bacterium]|nr:prepilin-type N-terminal cleavage/methylation domain-containing protein [Opitutales bacterium]